MTLDHSILTLITFVPLAGALLLAVLPDRGRTMAWTTLGVTLLTLLATATFSLSRTASGSVHR